MISHDMSKDTIDALCNGDMYLPIRITRRMATLHLKSPGYNIFFTCLKNTVVILDFHYRVLTNGSHLLSFQPMTTKIGMDEGLPIGSHLVPRKLTSASTRPHWRQKKKKIMP